MKYKIPASLVATALAFGLTACGSSEDPAPESPVTVTETSTEDAPGTQEGVATADLPDLVGMVLQDAQDTAQEAGFYGLEDRDALYDRLQVLDSNWKVCDQDPGPGQYNPENTTVILYSVKLDENCP